jgi:hypothetical protein
MYIRLFESGPGYDSIELQIKPASTQRFIEKSDRVVLCNDTGMASLCKVISTLFECTDIEEIGIGRERDKKKKEA